MKCFSINRNGSTIISKACARGFTIIELLITISILGLLLTVGLVYYQDFNRRQIVVQAARDLKNNLRLAQSKALAGEKEGCAGTFGGYKVDFYSDEYVISMLCNGVPIEYKRYPLLGTAWAGGPLYLIFKPLAQGVEIPLGGPAEITLSSTATNYSSKVIVDEGGEISLEDNVPFTTPSCVPEGGNKGTYPGAPDCCFGLTLLVKYTLDEEGCHPLYGGGVCAYCPNGVCGLGENYCNCPADCPSP